MVIRNSILPKANYDPYSVIIDYMRNEQLRMMDMNELDKMVYILSKNTATPEERNMESTLILYYKAVDMLDSFWLKRLLTINNEAGGDRIKFGSRLHGLYKGVGKFSEEVSQHIDDIAQIWLSKIKSNLKTQMQCIYDNLEVLWNNAYTHVMEEMKSSAIRQGYANATSEPLQPAHAYHLKLNSVVIIHNHVIGTKPKRATLSEPFPKDSVTA